MNLFGFSGATTSQIALLQATANQIVATLQTLQAQGAILMGTTANILAAQQKTAADLTALSTSTKALIAAFAAGTITPADAATILANEAAEDTGANTLNTSIQAVLNPPATGGPPASQPTA